MPPMKLDRNDEKYDDNWPDGSMEEFIWQRCEADNQRVREIMEEVEKRYICPNNPKVADEGKLCRHDTLHFEGKRLSWLVCSCGKRWERCVEYTKSIRSTRFRHTKKERCDV